MGQVQSPLMQQYFMLKKAYPDALMLFQVGDFFELFHDDARRAASVLGIALTQRGKSEGVPIPLCGVPCHAIDQYLVRLLQAGCRVVIAEQVGQSHAHKLVERTVTRVFTPGTLVDDRLTDPHAAVVLVAVAGSGASVALVWCDLLAGTAGYTVFDAEDRALLQGELLRLQPREILLATGSDFVALCGGITTAWCAVRPELRAQYGEGQQWWTERADLPFAGLYESSPALREACALLYAYGQHHAAEAFRVLGHCVLYQVSGYVMLDAVTQRNLELVRSAHEGGTRGTLWEVLNHAVTAMGSRRLQRWLLMPLRNLMEIRKRQSMITALVEAPLVRLLCREQLRVMGDLERTIGRAVVQRSLPAEYRSLVQGLEAIDRIVQVLAFSEHFCEMVQILQATAPVRAQVVQGVRTVIADDDGSGYRIATGYDEVLDQLRCEVVEAGRRMDALLERERQGTGITTLRLQSQGAHGYSFEVTKSYRDRVPTHYEALQTLVGRERFTTPELRSYVQELMRVQILVEAREQELWNEVVVRIAGQLLPLRDMTRTIGDLDALYGLAEAAIQEAFVCPRLHTERSCSIRKGRHPVIEAQLRAERGESRFVPNDVLLDESVSTWVITGPNMGGKSTFLRQTALIALLAHVGSWVPAEAADIPLLDRICTRVGASDNLVAGKSTFYLEMEEVALICRSATDTSLVLLDEIGRGTSTYDGLAIAQAVVEDLTTRARAYALCATHYHELTAVTAHLPGSAAYHAEVRMQGGEPVLLHTIRPGGTGESLGIAVARKAGVPTPIVMRAEALLIELHATRTREITSAGHGSREVQLARVCCCHEELQRRLLVRNCNDITPRDAWDVLCSLQDWYQNNPCRTHHLFDHQ